jgi:poly(A) polymerase
VIPERLEPLLSSEAAPMVLARLFGDAGHQLYLVGGTVRDALMDRVRPDADRLDLDFATDARPDRIRQIVSEWADDLYIAGEQFGTIAALHGGLTYEITTFRSEVYLDESRKPKVSFSNDILEDLSRRDFTINALAIRLGADGKEEPQLVDPHGGLIDLNRGLLRTPLGPDVAFGDDPLRMLRLYRFVSTLAFEVDERAAAAARSMAKRLDIVSAERIRDELSKLLVGESVGAGLWGLVESGLAVEFLPEIPALAVEQDPIHRHKDVLAHSIAVTEKVSPILERRLAALLHDIGKPQTRQISADGVTFYHHEVVGARMARHRMRALRFSREQVKNVSDLVFLHMRPHTYKMGWTDSAVRRYVRDAGAQLEALNELVRSDVTTRNKKRARAIGNRIDDLEQRIGELRAQESLEGLRAPIDGHAVMKYLNIEAGPGVGAIMRLLMERRIEHGPFTEEEAYELLDRWRDDQS